MKISSSLWKISVLSFIHLNINTSGNYFKVYVWLLCYLNPLWIHFFCLLFSLVLIFFPCLLIRLIIFSLSARYGVWRIVEIIEVCVDIIFLQRELTFVSARWLQALVIPDDLNLIRIWQEAGCCPWKNYLFLVHSCSIIFRYPKNSLFGRL